MSLIKPNSRYQLMLPSSIDEYVSEDNFVRFIDAFVDKSLQQVSLELLLKKVIAKVAKKVNEMMAHRPLFAW